MTIKHVAGLTAALAAAVALTYLAGGGGGKIPKDNIRAMAFPRGAALEQGADGTICHEVRTIDSEGRDVLLLRHRIAGDFKGATEAQRRQWIIDATIAAAERAELACVTPDGRWFQEAVAGPKICRDCSECVSWSCPATWREPQGYCTNGGTDCVITYLCCSQCNPTC